LTRIQAGDSSLPPFFAVISPGESGLGYAILARHMGTGQSFYQLQASKPIALGRPYTWEELENLAREYVAAMRRVQPSGPYFFGGMCDGAHIAIRMARKLEQSRESVGLLAILDTWVLENSQNPLLWKISYYSERLSQVRSMSVRERFGTFSRFAGRVGRRLLGRQGRSAWAQAYWPGKDYVPPRFNGRVTLFKRPKQPYYYKRDPLMGWGERAGAGVDVQVLPIHHREMLREPSVQVLAESLVDHLQKAYVASSPPIREDELLGELEVRVTGNSSGEAF
jgi:thioesterase domain-containing protein